MDLSDHPPHGWRASLRTIADSLLGLAQNRAELFALEWHEEKLRTLNLLLWLGIAFALGLAGLLVGVGALALFVWSAAGYAGLAGLAVAGLLAAAAIVWSVRRRVESGPAPFAETIAQFEKDRACLLKKN